MRLTHEQKILIVQQCRNGTTIKCVASRFGVSASTIDRILKKYRNNGESIILPLGRPPNNTWKPKTTKPSFDIRRVSLSVVEEMCVRYHAYGSIGSYSVYSFAVFEDEKPVASFSWQTPPYGAAQTICPEEPSAVLSLSRMVAVPKIERRLKHISKPLRYQMASLIDRSRWPVLITYSDEGLGHSGHVYKCSGWTPTKRSKRKFYVDEVGRRKSIPSNKDPQKNYIRYGGKTTLQRWEHRMCPSGETSEWMAKHGWKHIAIPGRVWRSGTPMLKWVREF